LLKGKNVSLRALEEHDLETLLNWRNKKHVRKTTREYKLLNMKNQKKWFDSIHNKNPPQDIMFGIVDKKQKLIGFTGLTHIDWKNRHSEISILLANEGWQKTTLGRESLKLITDYGFQELNLHRLWVEIFAIANDNIHLYEKMNFTKEGTLRDKVWRDGKWWDSFIYSKLSHEFSK